ncbi:outer membrane beta-barrel protein [Geomonas sp.]|uniref:outer membrane beta-barrel protein n=1 Tax=Geomonas sp. TaxID=2651584 RepID=UPI002B469041|nr:outer membrane beta-barrel protein [Geomonas sp.]HJV34925.1 outer membrane beta-barrel protein [Geomonas sp.]
MKKHIIVLCLAAAAVLAAGTANADSISGKIGVTGKIGLNIPADNDSDFFHNDTDVGLVGGGGVIYGIDHNWAAKAEVTRASFGSETGDFGVTDISFGAQYRFTPQNRLVPFAGAGFDILINDYYPNFNASRNVDTTLGAHLSGGVDYFLQRQLALTAELKGVLAPNVDITDRFGNHVGNFDPSSLSATVGVRYFFN